MSEATANDEPNRYLEGNYAPIQHETTAFDLPITGELPIELCGRYLRTGPDPINPEPGSHHWFIGDGMVHGIRLQDGKADWYPQPLCGINQPVKIPRPTGYSRTELERQPFRAEHQCWGLRR